MKPKYFYLLHLQYLGYRYHGWAKQPGIKTVHHMLDRTLRYVLGPDTYFKTLAGSRTDAMVSSNCSVVELFAMEPLETAVLEKEIQVNLPADIRLLKITETTAEFNIIQSPKVKSYTYLFTYGEKPHPFCASIMAWFHGELDIGLMQQAAQFIEGTHNFKKFCTRPSEKTVLVRTVDSSSIQENMQYTASFFPEISYIFRIASSGFMRHQIRLLMGQLVRVGRKEITLEDFKEMLHNPDDYSLNTIAPASGLILDKVMYE